MADKLLASHEVYEHLRTIITNLPQYVISLQLNLEPRELPLVRLECHPHGNDGAPLVVKDPLGIEVLAKVKGRYRLVREDDVQEFRDQLKTFIDLGENRLIEELPEVLKRARDILQQFTAA